MQSNPVLAAALEYRRIGLHPIPLEPGGKRPLLSTWREYMTRQPTEAEVAEWWRKYPDANVGLVLGRGLFALDVDGEEGSRALFDAGIDPTALAASAPSVRTGRGVHVYYRGDSPNAVNLLPHVDLRGAGGYVVAPPSRHVTGSTYEWLVPLRSLESVPDPPPGVRDLIARATRQPAAAANEPGWVAAALQGVAQGARDMTCTRLAGYLLHRGLAPDEVEAILTAWAGRCDPPFSEAEVRKCVASIARREHPAGDAAPEAAPISNLIEPALEELTAGRGPVKTDLPGLDALLDGGWRPGEYVLLGARPGVGKTALALQAARTAAKAGNGVLIVSREMSAAALVRRLLVQESPVRASALRQGALSEVERGWLEGGRSRLAALPVWITTSAATVEQVRDLVASLDTPPRLVVVDYLQLMRPPREIQDGRRGVEWVSRELRALAVSHNLTVLCLSSLSRPPKDSPNWRPRVSDLRESGELEHDADIILLLHREPGSDNLELHLAKQRDGRVGMVPLRFIADYLTVAPL